MDSERGAATRGCKEELSTESRGGTCNVDKEELFVLLVSFVDDVESRATDPVLEAVSIMGIAMGKIVESTDVLILEELGVEDFCFDWTVLR